MFLLATGKIDFLILIFLIIDFLLNTLLLKACFFPLPFLDFLETKFVYKGEVDVNRKKSYMDHRGKLKGLFAKF